MNIDSNLVKWPTFWDSYESAVHRNQELSDVDKFNYLKLLLDRAMLSAANYEEEANDILKKRFWNKQMIISKHMETLLNAEAVSSDTHLRDFRCLYDMTESYIGSLKSLGAAMLSSVFNTKLPPDLRCIVSSNYPRMSMGLPSR